MLCYDLAPFKQFYDHHCVLPPTPPEPRRGPTSHTTSTYPKPEIRNSSPRSSLRRKFLDAATAAKPIQPTHSPNVELRGTCGNPHAGVSGRSRNVTTRHDTTTHEVNICRSCGREIGGFPVERREEVLIESSGKKVEEGRRRRRGLGCMAEVCRLDGVYGMDG